MLTECARSAETLKRQLDELARLERDREYVADNLAALRIKIEISGSAGQYREGGFEFSHARLAEFLRRNLPAFMQQITSEQNEIVETTLAGLNAYMVQRKQPADLGTIETAS